MQGPFDKTPRGEPNIYQNWSIKLVAVPVLLVIAIVGYVVSHPQVASWVAEGVQSEFAGTDLEPDSARATRLAQPTNRVSTLRAH